MTKAERVEALLAEEFERLNNAVPCPSCRRDGNDGGFLGTLGIYNWFRCRECGAEFAREVR